MEDLDKFYKEWFFSLMNISFRNILYIFATRQSSYKISSQLYLYKLRFADSNFD